MNGIKMGLKYMIQFVVILSKAIAAEDWDAVKFLVPVLKLWLSEATGLPNYATETFKYVKNIPAIDIGWRYLIGRDPFRGSHDAYLEVLLRPEVSKYLE